MPLIQKERDYFEMFAEMAGFGRDASGRLCGLLREFSDVPAKVQAIKEIEYAADRRVKRITEHLNGSFITPIDRDDILLLTGRLDKVCDTANIAAQRLVMYNVSRITEDALAFAGLIETATQRLVDLVAELPRVKKTRAIPALIDEVNRIEHEGDELYHNSMRRLFSGSLDPLEVIKWNESYQSLEKVIDACEDAANTVQRIVVKYS
jgi:uncharacterized protein Yka (UPF0111/DUF47 family)